MKRISLVAIIIIIFWGCSATREQIIETEHNSKLESVEKAQQAQEFFIQGSLEEFNGDYKKAISFYENALKLDPSAGIYFTLSKNYLRLNNLAQSLQAAKNAVNLAPTNEEYLMQLGSVYFIARQSDSASTLFSRVISSDSANFQAYFYLGQALEENKPSEALSVYEKLLKKAGAEWDILLRIADLNTRLGNNHKTIETIQNLIKLDPSNLQLQKYLIESFINNSEYKQALKVVDENLISFPDDAELIEYKAKSLFSIDSTEASAAEYMKLIHNPALDYSKKHLIASAFMNEVANDSSLIHYAFEIISEIEKDSVNWELDSYLADLSIGMKNDSSAIYYLSRAADNADWNSQLWVRLAFLFYKSQKHPELIAKIKPASERFPDNFFINFFVSLAYNQLNQYSESLIYLERCVRINPNDIDALHSMGYTLHQLKRSKEAIPYLKDALKVQPNNIDVLSTLGLIYESLKAWNKSDSLYENILLRSPDNALVLNNYAYSLSERGDSLNFAYEMSLKALQKEPNNASYLDTYGWILYKLNKYEDAVKYISQAIEKENDNSTLYDHLGDALIQLGEEGKAVKAWERALQLDSSRIEIKEKIEKVNND